MSPSDHDPLAHIHALLRGAASLLDAAARASRDAPWQPKPTIREIGEILTRIFDIENRIYAERPDLMPAYLTEPMDERYRPMNETLNDAYKLVHEGKHDAALELIARFLDTAPEAEIREIVEAAAAAIDADGREV